MIKLSVEQKGINTLNKELALKQKAINSMLSETNLEEISRAAFIILKNRFLPAADVHARLNPKKMHHVYEWNRVGDKSARLFVLERTSFINNKLVITSKFTPSRTFVPIPQQLQRSGKTGKFVKSRHIFRNKADIMENGKVISLESRRIMAFMGRNGIHFTHPGDTMKILNPGGRQVKNAFEKFMVEWYSRNAQSIMDSYGLYEKIVKETSIVLSKNNTGAVDVQSAIKEVVESITNGSVML